MPSEPTLPVSQPMTAEEFQKTWAISKEGSWSGSRNWIWKFAEAYAAHVTAERDRELQQARVQIEIISCCRAQRL